jgi:tRNA pseudouridine55 synthase
MKDGILIIDKPQDLTSHDVVDLTRNALGIRRVGHAGTLDPLATGILIILVGRATKLFKYFLKFDKEYITTLSLGKSTDTLDAYGKVVSISQVPVLNREALEKIFQEFKGRVEQVPPMVSALKFKGKRLYQLARQGIEIPRQPRSVLVKKLELLELAQGQIEFDIVCSTGFYIRQLGQDIAARLGCCGFISRIRRVRVGPFELTDAISVNQINESHIRDWKSQ